MQNIHNNYLHRPFVMACIIYETKWTFFYYYFLKLSSRFISRRFYTVFERFSRFKSANILTIRFFRRLFSARYTRTPFEPRVPMALRARKINRRVSVFRSIVSSAASLWSRFSRSVNNVLLITVRVDFPQWIISLDYSPLGFGNK